MSPEAELAETSTPATKDRSSEGGDWLGDRITRLAKAVGGLHLQERRGDLASLRRMDVERPFLQPFQRILVNVAADANEEETRRIALFVKILALATNGEALRAGRRALGEAMDAAGVNERRVQMLMTARGEALDDLVLRLARRLVREGSLPYQDIGRLILGNEATIEKTRFLIARTFWVGRTRREEAGTPAPDANEPTDLNPAGEPE